MKTSSANTKQASIERQMLKHFWDVTLQYKRPLLLACFIPVSAIVVGSIIPLLVGKMLASLTNPSLSASHYIPYLIGFGVLGIVANRIGYANQLILQAKVMAHLQTEALQTLLARGSRFHNNQVSGRLVSDASDYPGAYNLLNNAVIITIIPFFIVVIAGIIIVGINSLLLGGLLLAMSAFTIGSGIYGTLGRTPLRLKRHKASKAVISHLADTIVNNQTVKTFAREDAEMLTHTKLNDTLLRLRINDWTQAARSNNFRVGMLIVFQILFVIAAVVMIHRDPALLAVGIFSLSYTITLSNKLMEVNQTIRTIEDAFLQGTPLTRYMREEPEILDMPNAATLAVDKGAISFSDVTFNYQEQQGQQDVFHKLQLTVQPGEKIGLVGPSGGGKSTLTRLLLRFEDVQSGSITIDDQNIAHVTQQSLRQAISYVPQEPLLFHRSIRENISYGRPDATEADIIAAATKARAHTFIEHLSDGYDTVVGERGVKLSGGQRQRIAIARAILKDAPILVLDEATSALDSESEAAIQRALWELMKGRTALVVAHRLSTIQRMDRIVVLDDGKIIEQGSHDQLIANNGLYAKLWAHQSGGFIEE